MHEAYIDGACEPVNPGGTATWGAAVFKIVDRAAHLVTERVWEDYGVVGTGLGMSNNVGEYAALSALLRWTTAHIAAIQKLEVRSDSNMLVMQMTGKFKVRRGLYVPYYEEARGLMDALPMTERAKVAFQWIPRERNLADALAMKALVEVGITRSRR